RRRCHHLLSEPRQEIYPDRARAPWALRALDRRRTPQRELTSGPDLSGGGGKRIQPVCPLARRGQGHLAIHAGYGHALRPEERPLGGRARGPWEVHARSGSTPEGPVSDVRRLVFGDGGLR